MRRVRHQPSTHELAKMSRLQLKAHARSEAALLEEQKQTAVPRLLRELASRL